MAGKSVTFCVYIHRYLVLLSFDPELFTDQVSCTTNDKERTRARASGTRCEHLIALLQSIQSSSGPVC